MSTSSIYYICIGISKLYTAYIDRQTLIWVGAKGGFYFLKISGVVILIAFSIKWVGGRGRRRVADFNFFITIPAQIKIFFKLKNIRKQSIENKFHEKKICWTQSTEDRTTNLQNAWNSNVAP